MKEEERRLDRLIQAIQLLAGDYETQVKAFPEFVHIPDELALIYDECMLFAADLAHSKLISERYLEQLQMINQFINQMSNDPSLWTLEALKYRSEWSRLRVLARELLSLLGIPQQAPDLSWLTYIPGRNP